MDMLVILMTIGVICTIGHTGTAVHPSLEAAEVRSAGALGRASFSSQKKRNADDGRHIIMLALLVAFLKFSDKSTEFWVLLVGSLGFGLVGFMDDYIKIVMKRSLGLTAKQKLAGQLLFSIIVCVLLYRMGQSTEITIPGTGLGWDLSWFYYPFVIIIFFATTNAVNFTDGVDGLLAGTSAIAAGAFTMIALQATQHESAVFSAALVGASLGFLVFNAHPAKVFMGDTGSLGIGGGLAAAAI